MNLDLIVSIIVSVLTGVAACIPLAVKLVQYIKKATQEKNWTALLGLLIDLMEQAEQKFDDGATRKEWVVAMVSSSAQYINYPVDEKVLSDLIDGLCSMADVVNASTPGSEVTTDGDVR